MENPANKDSTNYVRRFRCDENNVNLIYVQAHFYSMRQVEPGHRFDEVARQFSSCRYA